MSNSTNQDKRPEADALNETSKGEQVTERRPDSSAINGAANAQKNIQNDADSDFMQDSDNASDHSDSEEETELEVQSKEDPSFTNGSVQQSEAEKPAATMETKQAPAPVKKGNPNGNSKTVSQDRDLVKRELAQQVQQRLQPQSQPSLPPMHEPNRTEPQAQAQPLVQQPPYAQYPSVAPRGEGYRTSAVRESRIKDRPVSKKQAGDSALKIKIELDLEVEVDLYARIKGDVTIGLM